MNTSPVIVSDNVDQGEAWNERAFAEARIKYGDRLSHLNAALRRSREAGK